MSFLSNEFLPLVVGGVGVTGYLMSWATADGLSRRVQKSFVIASAVSGFLTGGGLAYILFDEFEFKRIAPIPATDRPVDTLPPPPPASAPGWVPENTGRTRHAIFMKSKTSLPPASQPGCVPLL